MVFFSLLLVVFGGLIQVLTLVVTRTGGILQNRAIYYFLNPIVNALRSLPFIILLIAVIPLTKLLVGTSLVLGLRLFPSPIYVGPYLGRLIETSLLEVNGYY